MKSHERRAGEPDVASRDVTQLLLDWSDGDRRALGELLPLVYDELKSVAHAQIRGERADHTLQTTAVVHEAYLRMVDLRRTRWRNRAYFFSAAAGMMRNILIDYARARRAKKRDGGRKVPLVDAVAMTSREAEELLALDDALLELERLDARQSRIVELRHFGGLSVEETAEVLEVSPTTVKRDWRLARAWLRQRMDGGDEIDGR